VERFYNFNRVERVRFGEGIAKITRISEAAVDYLDEAGRAFSVDLSECTRTWTCLTLGGAFPPGDDDDWSKFADDHADLIKSDVWRGVIGLRGVIDDPPWCQFLNRRRTQFEFRSREIIENDLLQPLARYGWQTFDGC
jgi:hypothetical protein